MGILGAKTLKLLDLVTLGLNVPKFQAIDANKLKENIKNFELIAKKIDSSLKSEKYAVRSSALIEDSKEKSFAGQFKTIINVDRESLASAIKQVTDHAKKLLNGKIEKFSILIQEYIEPDIAGVTFTRNPTGGREIVVEYHKGRGEEIVGGKIKPEKIQFYWNNTLEKTILPGLDQAIENFKKIENFYKFPQDIEWCIKNNTWYFLQTRPITTISNDDYQQSLFLDQILPKSEFYFEKTEISEIAQRPTQITKDLLEKIYKENGPIQQVYKKYKINYLPANILKIIGNELVVDREEELKTLLPSYSYFESKNLKPKLSKLSGILRTMKNIFSLYKINFNGYNKIFQNLKKTIEDQTEISTLEQFLEIFKKDYQIVFEINLLAGFAIKKLENLVKNDISISLLLSQGHQLLELDINTENFKGNSLEVSDENKFIRNIRVKNNNSSLQERWKKLSQHAVIYNQLREMSRWLVVKRINQLRQILFKVAEENNFKDKRKIYFAKIEEILKGKLSEIICEKRAEQYRKYSKFNMPKKLTFKPIHQDQKIQGISPGIAEGILIKESEIEEEKYRHVNKILYTKILSPDLVRYFEKIKGIVSEQGGMLSHLAIIAREHKLPVVTNFEIGEIKIGNKIEIDGSIGKIEKSYTTTLPQTSYTT